MDRKIPKIYLWVIGIIIYLVTLITHTYQAKNPPIVNITQRELLSISLITEPDEGINPVKNLISKATKSIDLVIYELDDKDIEKQLVEAKNNGIKVRVILQKNSYVKTLKTNEPAFKYLQQNGIDIKPASSRFALTHEKALVVDNQTALIMTFNLVKKYYKTGRDFGIVDSDTKDVSEIESVFEADWNNIPSSETNTTGLVWSPDSRDSLVSVINSAKKVLMVYNEEMADDKIEYALKNAAARGVQVMIVMTDSDNWHDAFNSLSASGVKIRTFSSKDKKIYIHAKMLIADESVAFVGSENFSAASLDKNRELGIILSNQDIIKNLESTFAQDWTNAAPI